MASRDPARGLVRVRSLPPGGSADEADVQVFLAGAWVTVIVDAMSPVDDAEEIRREISRAVKTSRAGRGGRRGR